MKRQVRALLCALVLTVSLAVPAAAADPGALQTILALGIMQGDEKGQLNLEQEVTRAQFVTMMVKASAQRDTLSGNGSGYSLYKDVKSTHWASEYIRAAVQSGWFNGYLDGTFRPDKTITLEEGCTALLRLLGYDSAALGGSFPAAQLNKASVIGLRNGVKTLQGQALTREECVQMFYNLLMAKTAQGQTYAATLGYSLSNGKVDYTAVVQNNLAGPFVAEEGETLPFVPVTVYRDGVKASSAMLNHYDVYYYNEGMATVWIYTTKAAGRVSALSPSAVDPDSVTVGGKSYSIANPAVSYALSVLGGGGIGDVVTLLLGMNGEAVAVITGEEVDTEYYGIVRASASVLSADGSAVEQQITVDCTDGQSHTFALTKKNDDLKAGGLVHVSVVSGKVTAKAVSEKNLSGRADENGIGDYEFASDVKIAEVAEHGGLTALQKADLLDENITKEEVLYYVLENGKITHLLLEDATGRLWTYGYLTKETGNSVGVDISETYTYLVNGRETTFHSTDKAYPVSVGGIAILTGSNGTVVSMRSLRSVKLTELGALTAYAKNAAYKMGDSVQVYLESDGVLYLTERSAVSAESHNLTGWYDTASESIRVIVAKAK